MMNKVKIGMRLILGLIYFVFGLNFFFHFIPMPSEPPPAMAQFAGGLASTGYMFQWIKTTEVVCGALLLLNLFVPLALVVLAPITLNIFMLHLFVDQSGFAMGFALLLLNLGLGILYLQHYRPLLKMKT